MDHSDRPAPRWRIPFWFALTGFMAVAGFFLITEHRAHFFGVLPFLLLLACPVMHFLHHGHGGHGHREHGSKPTRHGRTDASHQH